MQTPLAMVISPSTAAAATSAPKAVLLVSVAALLPVIPIDISVVVRTPAAPASSPTAAAPSVEGPALKEPSTLGLGWLQLAIVDQLVLFRDIVLLGHDLELLVLPPWLRVKG